MAEAPHLQAHCLVRWLGLALCSSWWTLYVVSLILPGLSRTCVDLDSAFWIWACLCYTRGLPISWLWGEVFFRLM
jgi:hypothetical protein